MIRVRRVSILFALGSAIYWYAIAGFVGIISPLGGLDVAPYWMVALASVGPAAFYAVITLLFCRWLARRVLKQAQKRSDQ